jgi:hypothetical protein
VGRTFRHNSRASRDLGPAWCDRCGDELATNWIYGQHGFGDEWEVHLCGTCLRQVTEPVVGRDGVRGFVRGFDGRQLRDLDHGGSA